MCSKVEAKRINNTFRRKNGRVWKENVSVDSAVTIE